ncbi:YsnF/AvaK domain-containing protein [Merismopedia glauca]|uniref:DUF2382 domain-containing protein n=1 Tax=Merismopedia glauca CCAP 1448/3 TaxID=1296344 RepID=A0A2T1C0Z8_9CYAN|nr:YsnF/AvaK domain-containing protein [Merismopedia glauca]PSB01874.1 hypothetical protein C7B64_16020 [Merismopedia glauca CCAP 1448/3]
MVINRPHNPPTEVNRNRRAIGTFPSRPAAEEALHELKNSGFNMEQVSVVAQDSDGNPNIAGTEVIDNTGNKADDGAKVGAASGGAVGGLTGLLVGIGALAIPGIGPIMLAGAAATALATTLAGGAIGAAAGSLLGGLVGLGIPEEQARAYQNRVSAGEYLVIVDGTDAEIAHAQNILSRRGIQDWGIYDIPNTGNTRTDSVGMVDTVPLAGVDRSATQELSQPTRAVDSPIYSTSEDINLYEERLKVDKQREKTGEVVVGKHTETEVARVSVPIEKERIVIERVIPTEEVGVSPINHAFQDGETIRMEVYEETADIRKEAFVREEISIRKEVSQETVQAEETLRREELSIDTQGSPVVDNSMNPTTDKRV